MKIVLSAALCLSAASFSALAADWPQFGGPERTQVSAEKGLLKEWPEGGPKVLWERPLGMGFGGPAIRDGQVYLLDRVNDAQDVLRCLELVSGKELWTFAYDAPGKTGYNGSHAVPTVTEKHVFSVGPFGQLYCVDRKTHEAVWNTSIIEPGAKMPNWALAQSPLVYGNTVIVSTLGKAGGLTAYRQDSGEVAWQAKVPGSAYSVPVLLKINEQEQIVFAHGKGLSGVDPKSGEVLWDFTAWKCGTPIPGAISIDAKRIFMTAGYKAGSIMLEIEGTTVKELWRTVEGSQIHQPILVDGCIYLNGKTNDRQDGLVCIDAASGTVLWRTGREGPNFDRGPVMYADGMLYLLDAGGKVDLVEPSRESFKLVASTAAILGGKDIWAPMALSDGKLLVRDQAQMKCLDVAKP